MLFSEAERQVSCRTRASRIRARWTRSSMEWIVPDRRLQQQRKLPAHRRCEKSSLPINRHKTSAEFRCSATPSSSYSETLPFYLSLVTSEF